MTKNMPSSHELNRVVFEGDNLDVLRGINSESVDLVYLDPPFNSNKTYEAPVGSKAAGAAFKDAWTVSDVDLIEHNRLKREHEWLYALIHAAKRTHSKGMFSYLMMMSPRLFELKRVLKATGSIYLHCDPTASHYLKLVMDGIFGSANFQNEVIWKRTGSHNRAKRWGPIHDTILFYSMGRKFTWNRVLQPLSADYVERSYTHEDARGRYQPISLLGPGRRQGDTGMPWRHVDPASRGRHWELPPDRSLPDWFVFPANYAELPARKRLDILEGQGLLYWPKKEDGIPRFKMYIGDHSGSPVQDLVLDIRPLSKTAKEKVGYPTQKPLALLERIIKASSNGGDMVLDPFCGCATTLVSAEFLNRQWCGIDLSPKAAELVVQRIRDHEDMISFAGFRHATDVPIRTDVERETASTPKQRTELKNKLYNDQEGRCNLCHDEFTGIQHFEMDHIFPRAKGGQDWVDNFQLLCANCNRIKGKGSQEAARAKIAQNKGMNFAVFE